MKYILRLNVLLSIFVLRVVFKREQALKRPNPVQYQVTVRYVTV